jgi:hypothetical protein
LFQDATSFQDFGHEELKIIERDWQRVNKNGALCVAESGQRP